MIRTAVLVSGNGSNLQALINAGRAGQLPSVQLALVVSSRSGVPALARAAKAGIPAQALPRSSYASPAAYSTALLQLLRRHRVRVLVLAGFLCILQADILQEYAGRIINVHPSLLPAFGGRGCYGLRVHQMALARGVKLTGASVHLVDESIDGGEILLQKAVKVLPGDSPESLQKRVLRLAEWQLLPKALQQLCAGLPGAAP